MTNLMQTSLQTEIAPVEVENNPSPSELLPLSFAQQRLWFFSQLEPNSALYNIPTAVRLTGSLDADALKKSLNEIVQRHETLRTNFISDAGNPVQVIRPQSNFQMSLVDLSSGEVEEHQQELQTFFATESQKPFDLANDTLFRATLLKLNSREHILFLNMHHIISDEWSMHVLFQELTILYKEFVSGASPSLPELPIQYADFALWQRECLQGETLERELSYWKQQLGNDFSPMELPTDHSRSAIQTYRGASCSVSLAQNILIQ